MEKEHRGFILALLAVLFSSAMSLFVKLSSSATVPTLVFARFVIGVPLFLWIAHRNHIALQWKEVPKNLTRSVAGIAALYAAYFAVQTLPLVNAVTLASTGPLFLPFLYLIWDKILVSKRRFFAVGLGFLGVYVILRPSTTEFMVLGSIFGLVAGLCRAIAIFNVRKLAKVEPTDKILTYYFFIGAVLSFFPLWLDWRSFTDPLQWFYVFLAGVFALGYQYAFTKANAWAAATKISSINYLAVVFGGLLGWWVFDEIPDFWVLLGASLIVLGALIAIFDKTAPIRF